MDLILHFRFLTDLSDLKCGKDNLDPHYRVCTRVVYKISCHNCEVSYIGQIKRQLRTRIKKHNSDIRKKNRFPSVITEHRLNINHEFEWDNIKIIDNETSYCYVQAPGFFILWEIQCFGGGKEEQQQLSLSLSLAGHAC